MRGTLVCLSLVAFALLAGFYSVVRGSVQASAVRRAEAVSTAPVKGRPAGVVGARMALVASPGRD